MRKIILPILCFFGILSMLPAQQRCGTDQVLERDKNRIPALERRIQESENDIQNWINSIGTSAHSREGDIITIPVVVHVVYKNEIENISDLQIRSQIAVLNQDFRLLNDDAAQIPAEFKSLAADIEIEFCLATFGPDGRPTNGINRVKTEIDCIGNILDTEVEDEPRLFYERHGGVPSWDPEHYLNIWVADACDRFLGASPNLTLSQFFPEEDGVVIDYRYFGTNCTAADVEPFHLGRTATHEIGHYFNLHHPWKNRCNEPGDYVADTPAQEEPYTGCPVYPQIDECGSSAMFMNYMNYVDDPCMYMFSEGQKLRMLATLDGPRKGLKNSQGCELLGSKFPFESSAISVYPNPAKECINISFNATIPGAVEVKLSDAMGRMVYYDLELSRNFSPIDAQSLPNGVYFLSFKAGNQMVTKKVLIAK